VYHPSRHQQDGKQIGHQADAAKEEEHLHAQRNKCRQKQYKCTAYRALASSFPFSFSRLAGWQTGMMAIRPMLTKKKNTCKQKQQSAGSSSQLFW
jgi:hypothetical protein